MKALFIGLGSIGQRHLINFKHLMGKDIEIIACRTTSHNILIKNGAGKKVVSLKECLGFREINSIDKALKEYPDAVFITNPTSKHMVTALKAVEYGIQNIFIEKPLSDNLKGINVLKHEAKKKHLTIMIGYQARFHPCYKVVKKILLEQEYGNIISANFEWGTYLPNHHPYEDYRNSYAAVRNLGGGVVLGLIHEVDIILSLWGQPKKLFAIGGKLSGLEMNTEDTVSVLMGFEQKTKMFPVMLFLSYAQTKEVRKFRIQLDRGTIFCDLLENSIKIFDENGKITMQRCFFNLKKNDLFLDEIKEFLSALREKRQPMITLKDGIESLRLALKVRKKISETFLDTE